MATPLWYLRYIKDQIVERLRRRKLQKLPESAGQEQETLWLIAPVEPDPPRGHLAAKRKAEIDATVLKALQLYTRHNPYRGGMCRCTGCNRTRDAVRDYLNDLEP